MRRTCEGGRCQLAYRQHLEAERPVCNVCGRPLAGEVVADAVRTCGELACRRGLAGLLAASGGGEAPRCGICRVLLRAERRGEPTCGCRECADVQFRREAAARAAERVKRIEEITRRAEWQRAELAQKEGIAEPDEYPITVIPSFGGGLSELPSDRVERFLEYLRGVIRDVFAEPFDPPGAPLPSGAEPDSPGPFAGEGGQGGPPVSLFAAACALCRGHCCSRGGEHAYISAETIRRFRARHPDATPEDVVAAYLAHIPPRTFTDSCVFHGELGCSMPGEMRAATCGDFFCDGLHFLGRQLEAGVPPRTFFVSVEDLTILGTKFVDATLAPQEDQASCCGVTPPAPPARG